MSWRGCWRGENERRYIRKGFLPDCSFQQPSTIRTLFLNIIPPFSENKGSRFLDAEDFHVRNSIKQAVPSAETDNIRQAHMQNILPEIRFHGIHIHDNQEYIRTLTGLFVHFHLQKDGS